MKSGVTWSWLGHAFAWPWVSLLLLWLSTFVGPSSVVFAILLMINNLFLHEWSGRLALLVSIVFLILGFVKGRKTIPHLAAMTCYALVFSVFAGYTIWWGATGQQYVWP
jgi:hypothetical protein